MTKFLPLILAIVFSSAAPVRAAPGAIAAAIEQQRQHGFTSPVLAIEQLAGVAAELPSAPVEVRMRYHAALSSLYIAAENPVMLKAELKELERMAVAEKCVPCGYYSLARQANQANRMQDVAAAKALLGKLEAITSADPDVMQAIHYQRGATNDVMGNHSRAIEEGLLAAQFAIKSGNRAEQVRSLNLLMLSNIGRRDLNRAEGLNKEAYALAERIGFVYMMAYIRGNAAWIHALKGEPEKQLAALTDTLNITRAHPGLGDAQLVALVNLAEYHAEQKSYKQAKELALQAIALADQQNKQTAKAVVMVSLGRAQAELGEMEQGVATLLQSVELLTKAGANSYLIDATAGLAFVYERAGRHKEALAALRKYVALKDEASKRDQEKAMTEAQEKFSGERKDHEIERLSLESARRQAEVDARAWQQRLWATLALALALGAVVLIQVIKRDRARNRLLEVSNAVLSDQSVHDPLTGAFNRRHCVALMGQQQEAMVAGKSRDRHYSAGVGLMLLDVDHFKQINDTYGHSAGDQVLVEIAHRLQALVRQHDVVVRWGGEEFVLVLPGTSPEGMTVLAERALKVIGGQPVMVDDNAVQVTVSAGCVSFPLFAGQPWEDSLKIADFAMYMAKQDGRNRAVCLIKVADGVQAELLLGDLGQAAAAGAVVLQTIIGPVPGFENDMLVAI